MQTITIPRPTLHVTNDFSSMGGRYHTVEDLGRNLALTPEGFLICKDVAIARTGEMIYGPDETGVEPGRDMIVRISRDESQVFRPETIASFEGKPVTNDHPTEEVGPHNYRDYVVGVVQNVRRGLGIHSDLLLADLLIQDKEAIQAVRDGKREVSCGYQADYIQDEPGRGRQVDIMGNHVALVEQGRCGPRCAIQDRRTVMSKKVSWLDRLKAARLVKDDAAIDAAIKEGEASTSESGNIVINVNDAKSTEGEQTLDARVKRIEDALVKLADKKTGDEDEEEEKKKAADKKSKDEDEEEMAYDEDEEEEGKKKTEDARKESWVQGFMAKAEILAPGYKLPTFDAKSEKFKDFACGCRRSVLKSAVKDEKTREVVEAFLGGKTLDKATNATVDAAFIGASELVRQKNNSSSGRSSTKTKDFGTQVTPSSINAANQKFWDKSANK